MATEPRADGGASELEELAHLEAGETLAVTRTAPTHASGWLEDMMVPEGGVDEVRNLIRNSYGGGRFLLQWKRRGPNANGMRFAKGSASILIAGEPKYHDQVYRNGRLVELETNPPAATVVHVPSPAPTPQRGGIESDLLRVALDSLKGGQSGVDVVRLVETLQRKLATPAVSAPTADAFGDIDRTLGVIEKLRKAFVGDSRARRDEPDDDEPSFGLLGGGRRGAMLEQILLEKFMGGGGGQSPRMPPPPSPNHAWHPQRGWVLLAAPEPSLGAMPSPQPSTPQPQPPPPPAASEPAADDDDSEPLTADELADELEHMAPEQQTRFMTIVLERMGVPRDELEAATAQVEAKVANLHGGR